MLNIYPVEIISSLCFVAIDSIIIFPRDSDSRVVINPSENIWNSYKSLVT
jgi:hypothetical protein